jgi:hypothetical protein
VTAVTGSNGITVYTRTGTGLASESFSLIVSC